MEIVRVNYAGGSPYIVPDGQLQDKSDRYYFQEAVRLDKREVYISPAYPNSMDESEPQVRPVDHDKDGLASSNQAVEDLGNTA